MGKPLPPKEPDNGGFAHNSRTPILVEKAKIKPLLDSLTANQETDDKRTVPPR